MIKGELTATEERRFRKPFSRPLQLTGTHSGPSQPMFERDEMLLFDLEESLTRFEHVSDPGLVRRLASADWVAP